MSTRRDTNFAQPSGNHMIFFFILFLCLSMDAYPTVTILSSSSSSNSSSSLSSTRTSLSCASCSQSNPRMTSLLSLSLSLFPSLSAFKPVNIFQTKRCFLLNPSRRLDSVQQATVQSSFSIHREDSVIVMQLTTIDGTHAVVFVQLNCVLE